MNKKYIKRLTVCAMLAALSIVSLYFIRFPLIPSAPFLEYDAADVPVMTAALMFGPVTGLVTLFCVCLIQALTVSASSGIIGFFMHFIASSVLVLLPALVYGKRGSNKALTVSLALSCVFMTVIMIPLNLIFTGIFMGVGSKAVIKMLVPAIIPFNLLKGIINCALTFAVFTPVKKIISGGKI